MGERHKKIVIRTLISCYAFSIVFHDRLMFGVQAEDTITNTNIVAVFVDSAIYDDIKPDIQRYTTQYIQDKLSRTKAVVMPIDASTFKARDIAKILDNMYFDGIKDKTANLVGTILIGNLPLPVVQYENYYFPSIYPYVDFEEPQYVFDENNKFFTYNDNDNAIPDIRHGVINFNTNIARYNDYFTKLQDYANNPEDFVAPKLWYDDFIAIQKYFNTDNLPYYANKTIFAEDKAYRRYSDFMMDILQGNHSKVVNNIANNFAQNLATALAQPDDMANQQVEAALTAYAANMQQRANQAQAEAGNIESQTPTLLLKKGIDEFLRPYNTMIGTQYSEIMRENTKAGGRRYLPDLDTHSEKLMQRDDVVFRDLDNVEPTIKLYNDMLQTKLNNKIVQEKYYMHIPLPIRQVVSKKEKGALVCVDYDIVYDMFYFGSKASLITSAQELSTFRGTFLNLESLSGVNLMTSTGKSSMASYNILSQQIEANRGYNVFNTKQEIKDYNFDDQGDNDITNNNYEDSNGKIYINRTVDCVGQGIRPGRWIPAWNKNFCLGAKVRSQDPSTSNPNNSSICQVDEDQTELPDGYAMRNRGGASPINITGDDMRLAVYLPKQAWKPIYDIAGSRAILSPEPEANSYIGIAKYGSLIKTEELGEPYQYPRCIDGTDKATLTVNGIQVVPKVTKTYTGAEYFNTLSNTPVGNRLVAGGLISLFQQNGACNFIGTNDYIKNTWIYKTIDSRVYNTAPTPLQISGMNMLTADRPIDSIRNITFQGIGGSIVKLEYPDLYDIDVYKQIDNRLVLKSVPEIEQAIVTYLQNTITKYNNQLTAQSNARNAFYNANASAFDLLAQANPLATPKNRTYNNLPTDFFVTALGSGTINTIAKLHYYINMPWPEKKINTKVLDDITDLQATIDINSKIIDTTTQYLTHNNDQGPLLTPDYNGSGYEVAYINTTDGFFIKGDKLPSFIEQIQKAQQKHKDNNIKKNTDTSDGYDANNDFGGLEEQKECGYDPTAPVPIMKRPAALICRGKQVAKKPFSLTLKFPNMDFDNFGSDIKDQLNTPLEGFAKDMNNFSDTRSQIAKTNQQNDTVIANASPSNANKLQDIMQYIITKTNVTARYAEPLTPQEKEIQILGTRNLGNIQISISATGDNCLYVAGKSNNLCNNPINLGSVNPFTDPIKLPVILDGAARPGTSKAGNTLLTFKLCTAGTCINKTQNLTILAGDVDSFELSHLSKVIAGSQTPLFASAYDRFSNPIGKTLQEISIQANTGTLNNGNNTSTGHTISDFAKAQFIYQPTKDTPHNTLATVLIANSGSLVWTSSQLRIVQPKLTYIYNGNTITNAISYSLPDSKDTIVTTDSNGLLQYQANTMPRLQINLKDIQGGALESMISVRSDNGLLIPGELRTDQTTVGNQTNLNWTKFIRKNNFYITTTGGSATVYFEPSFKAGTDKLYITIPGRDPEIINVVVKPAPANKILMTTDDTNAEAGDDISASIKITDRWDNQVTMITPVELGGIGPITIDGVKTKSINVLSGTVDFTINAISPGGLAYAYAHLASIALDEQLPAFAEIVVSRSLVPGSGLNVMYLNLRGDDRGNRRGYFSKMDKNYVSDLFANSPKLLAMTTQTVNPNKVNQISLMINQFGQIIHDQSDEIIYLQPDNNKFAIHISDQATIPLNNTNTYSLQLINNPDNIAFTNTQANHIIYVPDTELYTATVVNNQLKIDGQTVLNLANGAKHPDLQILIQEEQSDNTRNSWTVKRQGTIIGNIYIKSSLNINSTLPTIQVSDTNIQPRIAFTEGSTNGSIGIGLSIKDTPLDPESFAYKSMQNSDDETNFLGFRGDFKNISNFAQGQAVGEASKAYASAFVINYGDPLLQKISDNRTIEQTNVDAGIGQTIYSDPNKTILKTMSEDINNDGLSDIIVAHTDGSIKVLKNYGDSKPYDDIGNLLLIGDTIDDIFVGDVDGNGYPDIIVQTAEAQLRTYLNDQGIFEVDGKLICLNVAGSDTDQVTADFSQVHQTFIKDMDNDNDIDIVTNDMDGYIKVFYGGKTAGKPNYVSVGEEAGYTCDPNMFAQRQDTNMTIVKRFGIKVNPTLKIQDKSLIRRKGLALPAEDNPNNPLGSGLDNLGGGTGTTDAALTILQNQYQSEQIDTDQFTAGMNSLLQSQGALSALNAFDIDSIVAAGAFDLLRFTSNPFNKFIPQNETLSKEDIAYIGVGFFTGADKVNVYKYYEDLNGDILKAGDEVKVRVVIEGKATTTATFVDQIRGPWIINTNTKGEILTFDTGTGTSQLPAQADINRKPDNEDYNYIVDNIPLTNGKIIEFSYILYYQGGTPMQIDVKQVKHPNHVDDLFDITVQPQDACSKFMRTYFNTNQGVDRSYTEVFVDLWEEMATFNQDLESNAQDNLDQVSTMMSQSYTSQDLSNVQGVKDIIEARNPATVFDNINWNNPQLNLNLDMNILGGVLDDVSNFIDQGLAGLCNGFTIGGGQPCIQPPIPFNMSFLTPGTFNIFGCTLFQDKGLPLFFFPGTVYVMGAPIPMPYGLTNPGTDTFYRAPAGTNPSMIRIYLSPTLTAQLGMAICLGPMNASNAIPSPFSHIGGNCIVFKIPMPGCGGSNDDAMTDTSVKKEEVDPRWLDAANAGTCNNPPSTYGVKQDINSPIAVSPLQLMTQSPNSSYPAPALPANTYGFGTINLDKEPISIQDTFETIDGLKLKAGPKIKLKLQGGSMKGLVKCLIQDWLDNQIKYIINNLSQMSVGVYFPEPSSLVEGLEKVDLATIKEISFKSSTGLPGNNKPDINKLKGVKKLDGWVKNKRLHQGQMTYASTALSNPFQVISKIFADVKIITISQKDIPITIPMIYAEDITRYSSYLQTWVKVNADTLEEWDNALKGLLCTDENNNVSMDACQTFTDREKLAQFLQFKEESQAVISSVRQNLKTLELYQQFPLQLYEWIHVTDRYLGDIASLLGNFVGTLTMWLNVNARRFSQYVDVIITLIGVLKTRQVLIDFTVNRSESCGSCSNDNYDYYSCTLSFICPQIPVIPIPPFKIPNIFLDLSRINIGMNISLPNFIFVPTSIPLPQIPNLPAPPTVSINLDMFTIPKIPQLPPPPQLPALPGFIPQVNLELPVLPPAPKLPAISSAIQGALTAAEFVAKIFCLIKGQGIGLVAEASLKSKVEQMTQRSWNVPIFDFLDLTSKMQQPPLQGFDIQIDTFINLQFNFDQVFGIFDSIATEINKATKSYITEPMQEGIENASQFLQNNPVTTGIQNIQNGANINVDLNSYQAESTKFASTSNEVDASIVKNDISNAIAYLAALAPDNTNISHSIQDAQNTIAYDTQVTPMIEQIQSIGQQANQVIENKKTEIQNLKSTIQNDYAKFLDNIKKQDLKLVAENQSEISRSTPLLMVDNNTKKLLDEQEHPAITILDQNKQIASRYEQALANNHPSTLNMNAGDYSKTKAYIDEVQKTADSALDILHHAENNQNTQAVNIFPEQNTLTSRAEMRTQLALTNSPSIQLAQNNNGNGTCTNCNTSAQQSSDLSQYINGVYIEGANEQMINIVNSQYNAEQMHDHIIQDFNDDNSDDILLRDNNNIYIKYGDQDSDDGANHYTKFYHTNVFDNPEELYDAVDGQGYINIQESIGQSFKLKIADTNRSVRNFRIKGQSFDNITLGRTNSDIYGMQTNGYLIQINHRFDTFNDKEQIIGEVPAAKIDKGYILVLPEGSSLSGRIQLDEYNIPQNIQSLMTGVIFDVKYYDPSEQDIDITLTNLSRHWKYAQITSLHQANNIFYKDAPWSNQIVAGPQVLADEEAPVVEGLLTRISTNEVVGSGDIVAGFVGTTYKLDINRTDNLAVQENWIMSGGVITDVISGSSRTMTNLYFTGSQVINYQVGAKDFDDNITTAQITLRINIPTIDIVSIDEINEGLSTITAKISQDIDQGNVSFEKQRRGDRSILTGNSNGVATTFYPIGVGDTVVTGGAYSIGNDIGLYNNTQEQIVQIDSETAQVQILNPNYELRVYTTPHVPIIHVRGFTEQSNMFMVYLNPQSLASNNAIQILDQNYQAITLDNNFGSFSNGICIQNNANCITYVSPTGTIYIPSPYNNQINGTYIFDNTDQTNIYTLFYGNQTNPFAKIRFIAQPIVQQ